MTRGRDIPAAPDDPVADVVALAWMFQVPVGTLRRWAHRDRWPRRHSTTSRGRHTEYSVRAARDSYVRLRGDDTDAATDPASDS